MADLSICRVCLVHANNEKLLSVYMNDGQIPSQIFSISGVQIMEFSSYDIPALICEGCLKDLKIAVKFRNRCKNSDAYFRNLSFDVEELNWNKKLFTIKDNDDETYEIEREPSPKIKCEAIIEEHLESDHENNEEIDHISFEEIIEVDEESSFVEKTKNSLTAILYECLFCPQLSSTKSLDHHMKVKHDHNVSEVFSCYVCDKHYPVEKSLKRHMREVHSSKTSPHMCSDCKESFSSARMLSIHQYNVHDKEGNREYMCDTCGKVFETRRKVRKHISDTHLRVKKKPTSSDFSESFGPCSTCGKFFKTRGALACHEKIHIQVDPSNYYHCDLCGNKFKHKSPLYTHIKQRHLKKIRFHCPDCPERSWATKYALRSHIQFVHQNIRKFCCEWCGKGFGAKDKLKAHIRIHTGEKPFQCQFCQKRYTHQTDYIRHVWGHTGERRYTCMFCKQGYIKKNQLESHRCPWKDK